MASAPLSLAHRTGITCRRAAATLVGGFLRNRPLAEIDAALAARPAREQALLVGGVLAALALLSFLAAQFGVVGMLGFWLAVIVLVN